MGKKIIPAFVFAILITLVPMGGRSSTGHFPSLASQESHSGPNIFEAYDDTKPMKARLERLDAFAFYLKESQNFRAYIMSYGGRRSCRGEAFERARIAKDYLSRIGGIDQDRITAIDAGYLDNWAVYLWVGALGEAPPHPPDIDRRGVKIIKTCKSMTLKPRQ